MSPTTSSSANLEVTNRASSSSTSLYCSIGTSNDEPNTQLRPDQAAMLIDGVEEMLAVRTEEWQDVDFNVMLDSGCCRHVLPPSSIPGYQIRDTERSRSGHKFLTANGEGVPNLGAVTTNLGLDAGSGGGRTVSSSFEVCDMVAPLMSVHQLCQSGHTCTFTKDEAIVTSSGGEVLQRFKQNAGTYKATLKLKAPLPFGGQGR